MISFCVIDVEDVFHFSTDLPHVANNEIVIHAGQNDSITLIRFRDDEVYHRDDEVRCRSREPSPGEVGMKGKHWIDAKEVMTNSLHVFSHKAYLDGMVKSMIKSFNQRLLYGRRFSRYSAPIRWLVHGHMTFNNETVYRQMP